MEIHLSSKQANVVAGQSRSNFITQLLWNNLAGSNGSPVEGYELFVSDWMVPFTWYSTNASNNTVVFTANSVTYTVVIPQGNYNAYDLATYLATTMSAVAASESQVWTVEFDSSTGKFTFVKTSGTGTWGFVSGPLTVAASAASPAVAGDYTFTAHKQLGFDRTTDSAITTLAANDAEVVSTNVVNMMPVDRLFLELGWPGVKSFDALTNGHNEAMAQMSPPHDATWGSMISYHSPHTTRFRCKDHTRSLQIRLLDSDRNEVDLNGHDWYFTLTIYGMEGQTPMTNVGEKRHDDAHVTQRYNLAATTLPTKSIGAHDAPSRSWVGHSPAVTSGGAAMGASALQLNPARRNASNPFFTSS